MTPDNFKYTVNPEDNRSLHSPQLSEWSCELFGMGPNGLVFTPVKGKEPNFFWRWMQYICFGNKWIKGKK